MIAAATGAVILAIMAALNLRIGRSLLYPPAEFALIWTVLLALAALSTGVYYPLSVGSVALFCTGALAFSAGGALRFATGGRGGAHEPNEIPAPAKWVYRTLTASFIILLLAFPIYWRYILSLADPHFHNIWWGIRSGLIARSELQGQKDWQSFLFDNVTVVSILLALTAMVHHGERGLSKLVSYGLLGIAALYNLGTASRAGASTLLVGALGIRMMKQRRFSLRHMTAGLAAFGVVYVPLTLLRAGSSAGLTTALDDLRIIGDSVLLYTVGPLTAFDVYLHNPITLTETWSISYFFSHAANRMGMDVYAPSIHVGYVMVGPNATNVYTLYLAYYADFGWGGVILLTGLVGYLMVWVYQTASSRNSYFLILYGIGFNEIAKSGVSEGFLVGLNLWLKAAVFCLMMTILRRASAGHPAPTEPRRFKPEMKGQLCCE